MSIAKHYFEMEKENIRLREANDNLRTALSAVTPRMLPETKEYIEKLLRLLDAERARIANLQRERDQLNGDIEFLTDVRQAQRDSITKLKLALEEACRERDAVSKRAEIWRVRAQGEETQPVNPRLQDMLEEDARHKRFSNKVSQETLGCDATHPIQLNRNIDNQKAPNDAHTCQCC